MEKKYTRILKYICSVIIIIVPLIVVQAIIYKDQSVAILGYHSFIESDKRIEQNITDNMIMDIEIFEEQLKYLKKHNYKTLTLEEFNCFHQGNCKIPRKSVLITMDDGYQSNYDLAFPLLKKYDMNAVVFYLGINEDGKNKQYMSKETLKKIIKEYPNIEIASHSYNLHFEGSINQAKEKLINDIKKQKEIVNSRYYAYPYGAHNETMIEALKKEKYVMAFTFGPDKEHRKATQKDNNYKIPRLNISNDMPLWKFKLRLIMPK